MVLLKGNNFFKKVKEFTPFNYLNKKVLGISNFGEHAVLLSIYVLGIYSTMLYFFSFIGLTIGIVYYLVLPNKSWRKLGIILAWTAGISTFIVNFIGMRNALGKPSISTVYISLGMGPACIISYVMVALVWRSLKKKDSEISHKISNFIHGRRIISKKLKILLTFCIILFPIVSWWALSVNLRVLFDNNTKLLWIHAPTTVQRGSEFNITVEAWDSNERLSATYKGTVEFSIVSFDSNSLKKLYFISATLPEPYTFTGQLVGSDIAYEIRDGKDNGSHLFTIQIDTIGIHYLLVHDSLTNNIYWSNPIIVKNPSEKSQNIYWGDIHSHSALSDGSGTPEHHFYYANHVACLDFNAMTDHGELMLIEMGALDKAEKATNDAYAPGEFVTFPGIEWTDTKTGHYTCIFSGDKLIKDPVLSYFTVLTPQDLWNALDNFTASTEEHALALPHHTTKEEYITDWTYLNPKYVKIAEVTSVHGEFLFEQHDPLNYRGATDPTPTWTHGSAIMDALKMGYQLTLYGSGDEHDGHPGHSLSHTEAYIGHQRPWTKWVNRIDLPYPSGITAVHASALTRDAVFSGLENQRIYASSDHGRPILDFTINGVDVGDGSTLKVGSVFTPREISVFIAQDGAPAANKRPQSATVGPDWVPDWRCTLEIFKNGALLMKIPIDTPLAKVQYTDKSPITGTSYGIENCIEKDGKYYINEYSDNPVDPATLNTGGADFYVIRVVGDNGRTAYSGPIWVEY